jgi:23S rRNA (adenine-N6)-dimethyltransferase
LRDPAAVELFLAALPIDLPEKVLEVGAGDGALTDALSERFKHVIAYELDPAMAQRVRARTARSPNVNVINGDFVQATPPEESFHVAGNIPFAITARVVDWCLTKPTLTGATLITQLEYARKRTGDYGRWTLLTIQTWPWMEWRLQGRIGRQAFRPVPAVDAGVLALRRRSQPLIAAREREGWLRMVASGFSGIGGSLYASLRRHYTRRSVDRAFAAARLDRATVVAFVAPEQWVSLYPKLVVA